MDIILKDKEVGKRKGKKKEEKKKLMSAFIVIWHDLPRLPCAHNYRASQLICCEWYLDVLKILLSAQDSWARPRVSQFPQVVISWPSRLIIDPIVLYHAAVLYTQSCSTLRNPMDCSPSGPSVHGVLQATIVEWVIMPPSRGSSQPRGWTCISCFSCIPGRFFTTEPPGKPAVLYKYHHFPQVTW